MGDSDQNLTPHAMEQRPLTPAELRANLRVLIEQRFGEIAPRTLRAVSKAAGLQYTTLARYFGLYPNRRQTERLHEVTLRAVLLALGEDPPKFLSATSERQLEFWPAPLNDVRPMAPSDPLLSLRTLLDEVSELSLPARTRACRSAASAILSSVSESGEAVSERAYECLRALDTLQREFRHLKAG